MTEFYSNLPQKLKDSLQKTADRLVDTDYKEKFEFAAGDYDAAVGFFIKRGFSRQSAEDTCARSLMRPETLSFLNICIK